MVRRRVSILLLLGAFMAIPALASAQDANTKSKYEQLIDKMKKVDGMWTLFHGDQKLLVELSSASLKKEYIIIPSISQGISQGMVLGGMSWGFGDDMIWAFRQTEDKLFVIQRNVRYRAKANSPEAAAVEIAYSDSVLYSLPILTKTPSGGVLVDMTSVFMNDDLQIGGEIGPGFRFAGDRSTFAKVKAFKENVELQMNYVYSGSMPIVTVPNSRGVQVGVHYSVSTLPAIGSNGYKPRLADDRVGYFVTAVKDFSDSKEPDNFIRYVNRWNLKKLDADIDLSPPQEPIRFYIEKTVPVYLRPTVEAGILEWNKAFEKLGFAGAIKVDQQPDDPNFDPENIHYNTFRWMTAEANFAMGPSRIDPRTGQILDADIIFDAGFLDAWSQRWETLVGDDIARLQANWSPADADPLMAHTHTHRHGAFCNYCQERQQHNGFAAAFFMATGAANDGKLPKEFIHQGLKDVVMHEVGHTLGLRHNFKASTWKNLDQINDKTAGEAEGIVASVMDYTPPNINVNKDKQGLYYTQTIGPYDYWAIEYGYRPFKSDEDKELKKIASRSGEPALQYLTDEDTRMYDPDPHSNRFDLGQDPLQYVSRQMELSAKLLPDLVDRTVKEGEGYQKARQAYGLLFREYWRSISFAARFPGGIHVTRHHKGDENAKPPFETVPAARQREAMELISKSAFAAPELNGQQLNYLAASRWYHWGVSQPTRVDFPIHSTVVDLQDQVLSQVLNSTSLDRILDGEFKAEKEEDAYTLAEHFKLLTGSIFSEWAETPETKEFTDREPLVVSFRRNLQRRAIRRLGFLAAQNSSAPSDARTLSRMHLRDLKSQAEKLLEQEDLKLDDYSRAHLQDSIVMINTVLNPELSLPNVN